MIKDYYYLLGLPRSASPSEIKQAYRKLAAQYHPDRIAAEDKQALAEATKKMTELNEAIKILSDPARKAEYDQQVELIPERPLSKKAQRAEAASPPGATAPAREPKPAPPSPRPEQEAPPAPPLAAATPPLPVVPRRAEPRPEAHADPEYGTHLKAALGRAAVKWTELRLRGWDWALESAELRRGILVVCRVMDSLSRLSAQALQSALEALREQRKSPLRKTTIVAAVHVGRLMDAKVVREQLQELAGATGGLLGNVQSLVLFREGNMKPVVFGSAGDDSQAAEVLRILLAVN